MFYFILCILIGLGGVVYWWMTITFDHWAKRGVTHRKPVLLHGNIKDVVAGKKARRDLLREIYMEGEGHKYVGVFEGRAPLLLVRDLDLIKKMMVDFDYFARKPARVGVSNAICEKMLPFCDPVLWKKLRSIYQTAFTATKVNSLIESMDTSAAHIVQSINQQIEITSKTEVNFLEKTNKYTENVAARISFGIEFLEGNDTFVKNVKAVWRRPFFIQKLHQYANMLHLPKWVRDKVPFCLHNPDSYNKFVTIFKEVMENRCQNNIKRKDILQYTIDAVHHPSVSTELMHGDETIINLFGFFFALFESSPTLLAAIMHTLASNPKVQTKLREEVVKELAASKGQLTNEVLANMSYLKMVVLESLRLFPPLSTFSRSCTKSYELDEKLRLEPGDAITFSINGIHSDPKHYEEPEKFIPERFSEKEKRKRHPFTFVPFGAGPRHCLGYRIALNQTQVLIARLVSTFVIELSEKTPELRFSTKGPNLELDQPLYLFFKPINLSQ